MNRSRSYSCIRNVTAGALASAFALSFASAASAAEEKKEPYPCSPIEVISHASPGGGTDTTARMMMIRARRLLDTDLVVVYKRGGGARAAHEYFNQKPADGCTIMAITDTHMNTLVEGSPITLEDMQPVARAMDDPMLVVVHADSKWQTIDDVVEDSKDGALNWANAGIGTTDHVAQQLLTDAIGIPYKAVPFGSAGPMMNAMLSKATDITTPNVSEVIGHINDGTMRPILVLSEERMSEYPDVPTAMEKGWDVVQSTTRGYVTKKGIPEDRLKRLEDAVLKSMRHDTFANYLKSSGLNPETTTGGADKWGQNLKRMYENAQTAHEKMGVKK